MQKKIPKNHKNPKFQKIGSFAPGVPEIGRQHGVTVDVDIDGGVCRLHTSRCALENVGPRGDLGLPKVADLQLLGARGALLVPDREPMHADAGILVPLDRYTPGKLGTQRTRRVFGTDLHVPKLRGLEQFFFFFFFFVNFGIVLKSPTHQK
jgi:hypothetical protein